MALQARTGSDHHAYYLSTHYFVILKTARRKNQSVKQIPNSSTNLEFDDDDDDILLI